MADKVILAKQTVPFTDAGEGFHNAAVETTAALKVGETYCIHWDGDERQYTAFELDGAVIIGEENCDPLAVSFMSKDLSGLDADMLFFSTVSSEAEHTVAVYQVEEEEVGIILRDYKDDPTEFYGKETLEVPNTEGGTTFFVREDLVPVVEDLTVEPDFSGGDMVITPEAGKAYNSITVKKPENLVEENIRANEVVAGILGSLVAGGNATLVCKTGYFVPSADTTSYTVTHDLGVIPDIAVVIASCKTITTSKIITGLFSVSSALAAKGCQGMACSTQSTLGVSAGLESSSSMMSKYGAIRNATESTFECGGSTWPLGSGIDYEWIVIGGLT